MNKTAEHQIVYVRAVLAAELPQEVQERLPGREQVYAIHGENGERLALVDNRKLAFAVARQNEFSPVSVH